LEVACYIRSRNFLDEIKCDFRYKNYFGTILPLLKALIINFLITLIFFYITVWFLKRINKKIDVTWKKITLFTIMYFFIFILFLRILFKLY